MKKFSFALLLATLGVTPAVHALPINGSGAGGYVNITNSSIDSTIRSKNDSNSEFCGNGASICNISGKSTISGAGAMVSITNSHIKSTIDSSNGKSNQYCNSAVCNLGRN